MPFSCVPFFIPQKHRIMAIREIDEETFEERGPARDPLVRMFTQEVAWYESTKIELIGSVILDKTDKDWSYVILAPDESSAYRWIKGDVSIEDEATATAELVIEMMKIEKTGKVVEDLYTEDEEAKPEATTTLLFTNINEELKKYFSKHPEDLYKLSPRKFEELIASIMKGCQITRDNKNIVALCDNLHENIQTHDRRSDAGPGIDRGA